MTDATITGACHCGSVRFTLAAAPAEVTQCNCSLCRRYGVLWHYLDADALRLDPATTPTVRYAWNGRHVDFHHCATCFCLTHWTPRDDGERRGVNARLLTPAVLAAARVRHKDGAGSGDYID